LVQVTVEPDLTVMTAGLNVKFVIATDVVATGLDAGDGVDVGVAGRSVGAAAAG
jgi:hypothetical protein